MLLLLNVVCLEMCLARISGIYFSITEQHCVVAFTALTVILVKVF